ncbi:LysR substrate-binding domain-containing protein [Vibrio sp. RC27]
MPNKLPPLNALKTFEVAARKLSFSLAAKELCVTQGAVSKQIKLLEQYLELPLFDRINGSLKLTEEGRQYLPTIMSALDQIQTSTSRLQQFSQETKHITIDVTPSFSNLWLIPRLTQLNQLVPNMKLNIISGDGYYQFHQSSADIAIRCLTLSLTHDNATLLRSETMLPLVHRDFLDSHPMENSTDLLALPLLMHTTRPQIWDQFISQQVNQGELSSNPNFYHGFEHFFMSIEAAKHKQGVALVPDFLAEAALTSGELVNPLNLSFASGYGFYFLAPSYRQSSPIIQTLYEWFDKSLKVT